jgi:hypothetical protein
LCGKDLDAQIRKKGRAAKRLAESGFADESPDGTV